MLRAIIIIAIIFIFCKPVSSERKSMLQTPMTLDQLVSFKSVGLPYNPSIFINDKPYARQEIIDILKGIKDQGLEYTLTSGFGEGHKSPEHTKYGTAVDLVPTGETQYEDLVNALEQAGMSSLIHGDDTPLHGKHIHTYPSKEMLDRYMEDINEPQDTGENKTMLRNNMTNQLPFIGGGGNVPFTPSRPILNPNISGINTPPVVPSLTPPLVPPPTPPISPIVNQQNRGMDLTPLSLALMGIGQGMAARGGMPINMQPVMQYKMQQRAKGDDKLKAQNLTNFLNKQGFDIPEGIESSKEVEELANLHTKMQKAQTQEDYQQRLLDLRERELDHKLKADTGVTDLFKNSKDPALVLMSLKNDPTKWNSLSPEVQAKADEYLDLKVKEASKVFDTKFAETQGKLRGQVRGDVTIGDVEREKTLGKELKYIGDEGEVIPMAGTKEARDIEKNKQTKIAQLQGMKADSQIALDTIDEALSKSNILATGFVGGITKGAPGTPAHDLQQLISTIESKIGLGKLIEMKRTSATGASGFGQLSEKELSLLTASIASLKQSQTTEQFKKNLNKVKKHYARVQKAINDELGADTQTTGNENVTLDDLWGE